MSVLLYVHRKRDAFPPSLYLCSHQGSAPTLPNFFMCPLCFVTAYKMTSYPSVLAGGSDSKKPDLYYLAPLHRSSSVLYHNFRAIMYVTSFSSILYCSNLRLISNMLFEHTHPFYILDIYVFSLSGIPALFSPSSHLAQTKYHAIFQAHASFSLILFLTLVALSKHFFGEYVWKGFRNGRNLMRRISP